MRMKFSFLHGGFLLPNDLDMCNVIQAPNITQEIQFPAAECLVLPIFSYPGTFGS